MGPRRVRGRTRPSRRRATTTSCGRSTGPDTGHVGLVQRWWWPSVSWWGVASGRGTGPPEPRRGLRRHARPCVPWSRSAMRISRITEWVEGAWPARPIKEGSDRMVTRWRRLVACVGVGLLVAAGIAGCELALVIPSGAQTVHATVTRDSVRLEPATVHAGMVYLTVDSDGAELMFIGGGNSRERRSGRVHGPAPQRRPPRRPGPLLHLVRLPERRGAGERQRAGRAPAREVPLPAGRDRDPGARGIRLHPPRRRGRARGRALKTDAVRVADELRRER